MAILLHSISLVKNTISMSKILYSGTHKAQTEGQRLTWCLEVYEGCGWSGCNLETHGPGALEIAGQIADAQRQLPLEGTRLVEMREASEGTLPLEHRQCCVWSLYRVRVAHCLLRCHCCHWHFCNRGDQV